MNVSMLYIYNLYMLRKLGSRRSINLQFNRKQIENSNNLLSFCFKNFWEIHILLIEREEGGGRFMNPLNVTVVIIDFHQIVLIILFARKSILKVHVFRLGVENANHFIIQ